MNTESLKRHKAMTIVVCGLIGLVGGTFLNSPTLGTILGLMAGLCFAFGEKRL